MSDFDERDPFPEASIPEGTSDAPEPAAAAAAPVEAAPPEPVATADASSAGEPSTAPVTDAAQAPPSAVPPSEAPTIPIIPVERLRFQALPPGGEAAAPPIAERVSSEATPAAAASLEPVRREPPPPMAAAPARPAGPASAERGTSGPPPAPAPMPGPTPAERDLTDRRQPLYRECRGYRLRLDPPDLARLRELPGSRGKSDDEIGEAFFDGQADRLAESIAGDVPTPSEVRVVVDPYSRQAFLALENRIRGILSF